MSDAVSVVICAYTTRRWDDLRAAVASVTAQLLPADELLLVIDHNEELLEQARRDLTGGQVRVLPNSGSRGLSGARNTGVAASRCALVGFVDDDATAGPGWLAGIRSAFADPEVAAAGSAIHPLWPAGTRPAWFPAEFDWVVGCTYRGLPTEPTDVRNVIGAGMAFRRDVVDLAGGFSEQVGRIGTAPTGCEETELCIRIRQAKPQLRIRYLPQLSVAHRVTPERLTTAYFLRRCLGEGRSKARVSRLVGRSAGLSSERSYVSRVLPRALLRELRRGLTGRPAGWRAAALIVAGVAGAGVGYLTGQRIGGTSP